MEALIPPTWNYNDRSDRSVTNIMFMNTESLRVDAFWDEEAQVWTASSEDIPGLATEAESLEALTQKLMVLAPELLQLNQVTSSAKP